MTASKSLVFSALAAGFLIAGGQQPTPATAAPAQPAKTAQAQPAKTAQIMAKPKVAAKRKVVPQKPPKPPWLEFKLNPKTRMLLDFTEADPNQAVSLFARTSGITILKDPSFKTPLTFTSARQVALPEAFEIFDAELKMNGFELKKEGKLLEVEKSSPPVPPAPPMPPSPAPGPSPAPPGDESVIHVYPLKFANASTVAKVVNEVFSPQQLQDMIQQLQNGGGMPMPGPQGMQFGGPQKPSAPKIVRASFDDYSNSVVVNAPKKFQDMVADLIKQLDQSSDQPLETKTFKLKYVTADQVVDAVQSVLTANSPTGRGSGKPQDNNQNQGFFYYGPRQEQPQKGSQTVIAVKQTNSVIVSATKENMPLVTDLIASLDQKNNWVGSAHVIHLHFADATVLADILNKAFTQRRDVNQSPFFFIGDFGSSDSNRQSSQTDQNENGEIINVKDLTGKVNVIAEATTNSLIVVTLPSNLAMVEQIVRDLDTVVPQVMIETVIVEANLERKNQLGIEWNFTQNKILGSGTSATGSQSFGLQGQNPPLQGLNYTLSGASYSAFLNALETDTRFKVLSAPRIFTSNNIKAEINVSTKLPYINSQQEGALGNLISNYQFLDVGVILDVTPRITASGQVAMVVDQSADDLQGFTSFNAPIVNHRAATTTVSVNDGDTIVLGGIIGTTKNRTVNKVPLLGDIPLLGNLFRNTSDDVQRTELLVLLTPHIVRTPEEAQRLKEQQTKGLSKDSQGELKGAGKP